jgi:hypothetical protein
VADAGGIVAAAVLAGSGLLAIDGQCRRQFDRPIRVLTVLLLVGATPLAAAIAAGAIIDTALFAALALLGYIVQSRVTRRSVQAVVIALTALLLPLIAPAAASPPTLFAPTNGFLALTPVVYVAAIGTVLSAPAHPALLAGLVVTFAIWPPTNTAMLPALAWLGPGLAEVLEWCRRRPLIAAAPLVAATVLWNYWLMVQFTAGMVPKDAPVSFAALVRQQADVHTWPPYFYPFAFPGNVVNAWREGIPVGRYDTLSAEPLRDRFEIAFDRNADRFLLDGWGAAGRSAEGPFRPTVSTRAEVVFPLRPDHRDWEILVVATPRSQTTDATEADVAINGHGIGQIRVLSTGPAEVRLRIAAADVGRVLRAGYNRLSIVTSTTSQIAVHRLRIAPSA